MGSTSHRNWLARACSAVQRLEGSSVNMWSSRSRAKVGRLETDIVIIKEVPLPVNTNKKINTFMHLADMSKTTCTALDVYIFNIQEHNHGEKKSCTTKNFNNNNKCWLSSKSAY